jgi:hypothetical protein
MPLMGTVTDSHGQSRTVMGTVTDSQGRGGYCAISPIHLVIDYVIHTNQIQTTYPGMPN